jgi:hypothetical protein
MAATSDIHHVFSLTGPALVYFDDNCRKNFSWDFWQESQTGEAKTICLTLIPSTDISSKLYPLAMGDGDMG